MVWVCPFSLFLQSFKNFLSRQDQLDFLIFMIKRYQHVFHLVTPLEHVLLPVLDGVVDVQELEDAVATDVVGVALGLLPAQRRALRQQPHGRLGRRSPRSGGRSLQARGATDSQESAGGGGGRAGLLTRAGSPSG